MKKSFLIILSLMTAMLLLIIGCQSNTGEGNLKSKEHQPLRLHCQNLLLLKYQMFQEKQVKMKRAKSNHILKGQALRSHRRIW
jgi:hypothetical protein